MLNHRLVLGALKISSAPVDAPKKGPLASSDHARPQLGGVSNSMGDCRVRWFSRPGKKSGYEEMKLGTSTVSTHNISF